MFDLNRAPLQHGVGFDFNDLDEPLIRSQAWQQRPDWLDRGAPRPESAVGNNDETTAETAEERARRQYGPGAYEPDAEEATAADPDAKTDDRAGAPDSTDGQATVEQDVSGENEALAPDAEAGNDSARAEQDDASGEGVSARDNSPPRDRYVKTDAIKAAVQGREADVVRALNIAWPPARGTHLNCPYPGHDDHNPSWRLDDSGTIFCSANCQHGSRPHSVFDAVMIIAGVDFEAAKIRIAEILNRHDLIVDPSTAQGVTLAQIAEAKRLPVQELLNAGWFDLKAQGKNHNLQPAIGIPYRDRGDGVGSRWMRIRISLGGNTKKRFLWRKGDVAKHGKAPLYGAWMLTGELPRYIVLVEGETDAITLWKNGIPALGIPGSPGGWNEERHVPLLDGIAHIVVVIEPDGGGAALLQRLASSAIASRLRVLRMPPNAKDPNALWCNDPDGFKEAFMALLNAAEPFDLDKDAPTDPVPLASFTAGEPRRRKPNKDVDGPVPLRGLPIIEYAGGRLAEATDEAEKLLAAADPHIFQRSDFLVRLGFAEDMTAADGEKIKGPRLVPVDAVHLQDRMNRCIDFQKFDAKKNDYKSINPPRDVAEALRQRKGLWQHIPAIDGLTTAPMFRADGSILDQPGFDPTTRVLYVPTPGFAYHPIPPEPTKDEARRALDRLCGLIAEFPFIQENGDVATGQPSPSRSVALSALITPIVRRAILSAPIHGFDATEAGSGKSKLCSLPSILARGHAAPVIPGGSALNPEEFEKKISTSLIGADAIVVIDNVEGRLSSELLCSAATERMLYIRVLGFSKHILVPNGATFFVNGNGLTIIGDLVRRSIRAGLDPKVDRPELRIFTTEDPVLRALRDRAVYVAGILTLLRAFHVAGRPRQVEPLGSFEEWSRLVRDGLIWLGEPDPCETMERTRKQDPRRRALADILYWWNAAIGRHEVTAKRVIEYAEEREPPKSRTDFNTPPLRYPEFREALMAVAAGKDGNVDPVRFGQWLGRNAMKFVEGLRIEPGLAVDHSGSGRWKVVPVPA